MIARRGQDVSEGATEHVAARRWRVALRPPPDPGFAALRRATRAALVIPVLFACAKGLIGQAQVTTFVAFGSFALLVLADFGGMRRPRAAAYLGTVLVGAALVTLGTAASATPWTAALAMFVVAFCIQFVGVFGSYAAAAQTALLLSFVLAVSIPAPFAAVGARLAGWGIAGVASMLAATLLWPRFEHLALRRDAADACSALAALIAARRQRLAATEVDRCRQEAQAAVDAAQQSFAATPKRPAAPARRDRAFVELLSELNRILSFVTGPLDTRLSAHHPCTEAGNALAAAVVRTLEASATVLTGGAAPDLNRLQEARMAHRRALDHWGEEALRAGKTPEAVLDDLEADDALRIVSYLVLALGSNALLVAGARLNPELHLPAETPRGEGVASALGRVGRTLQTHLAPTSSVLHNSLRVGLGLALAVLLSRLLQLDHAFWVVLGTLSALRSNALATGRTTLEALAGTTAGVIVGALAVVVIGTSSPVLWAVLPLGIFLAAYAASTIGFVAGQGAFTVVVIILFNLIAPEGWRIGLTRIEDVAIGTGISLLAGVLLWPRGARGELRRTLAEMYRSLATLLGAAFARTMNHSSDADLAAARGSAIRAQERAGEAFDQFLHERKAKPLDPQIVASLLASGAHAVLAADLLIGSATKGYQVQGQGAGIAVLQAQAAALVASFVEVADRLEHDQAATPPAIISEEALRGAAVARLRHWQEYPADGAAAIAAVTVAEWIELLGRLVAGSPAPVSALVEATRAPWWR